MIGHIRGIVLEKQGDSALIDVQGLGYRVYIMNESLAAMREGEETSLYTHLVVRETALDLYGFPSTQALRVFELLLSVSGIGPKSALSILDIASIETLKAAVGKSDASYLTKVSGIGKKTAEKIIVELQDKMDISDMEESETAQDDLDSIEALRSMGYSMHEAREALKGVNKSIESSSERLREALKALGSRK